MEQDLLYPRHLVKSQQFDLTQLHSLFTLADDFRDPDFAKERLESLKGRIVATLFYEPSTRTRFSFEAAALRLGAGVVSTENAREFSSAAKGETPEDTIRTVAKYADLVVVRHNEMGAVERMALMDAVPVINAGDGIGQHPTQALLDVYTIRQRFGYIDGLTIAMMGDLANGRTVHSLSYLLAKYAVSKLVFISPSVVPIKANIKEYLNRHRVSFEEQPNLLEVISKVDVLYQTRIQRERFSDLSEYEQACGHYMIDQSVVDQMKPESIIMHPLPRNAEISTEVDNDPRAYYFTQAGNGLFVRMAVLTQMLNGLC